MEREQRKELNKKNAHAKYMANYQKMQARQYYDEQKDKADMENYYKSLNLNKIEDLTYDKLHDLLSSTYKHAKRRENLFSVIDRQPDMTLKCVYTQKILENKEADRLMKCDEEHSVPQSYQARTGKGCGKDMHQMFAAEKHANGSRGNKPFGIGALFGIDNRVQYSQKESESGVVYEVRSQQGEFVKTFSPKYNMGAVARATLYILVCYDQAMNPFKFPKNLLEWIKEKALNEEITLWEKHRNQEIFRLQYNRNPFIDHPEWIQLIDFDKGYQQVVVQQQEQQQDVEEEDFEIIEKDSETESN